jgi:hypothetical protein
MRLAIIAAACCGAVLAACVRTAPAPAPITARVAIDRLIDSARTAGLPTAPLISKVQEGVVKGASDERILLAVQAQVREEAQRRGRP